MQQDQHCTLAIHFALYWLRSKDAAGKTYHGNVGIRGAGPARDKASGTGGDWVTTHGGDCTCDYAIYTFRTGIRFCTSTARYVALACSATFSNR